jgi:hypothetical protein
VSSINCTLCAVFWVGNLGLQFHRELGAESMLTRLARVIERFASAQTFPCRGLAAVCLLENPLGSGLAQDMKAGNNFVGAAKQLWHGRRQRRAVQGELPVSDIEKDTSEDANDEADAKMAPVTANTAAHPL